MILCEHCNVAEAKLCATSQGPDAQAQFLCGQCADSLFPKSRREVRGHTIDALPGGDLTREWNRVCGPLEEMLRCHNQLAEQILMQEKLQ